MPELPEVETIKRDLDTAILHKTIIYIEIYKPRSFKNPQNLSISGNISSIRRHGKYLLIDIERQSTLLIHLRMTGKLIYQSSYTYSPIDKHISLIVRFNNADCLIFNDVRTFGGLEVIPYKARLIDIRNVGADALSTDFDGIYLYEKCKHKKMPIKNLLLDQSIVAGIGNIYAIEILFSARISPKRITCTLSKAEIQKIYKQTIKILKLAINHNGTSISDFRRVDDKSGEFQNFLQIYGKETCPICHSKLIKIKQCGRSSIYCGVCQK
jgi:formamidopyrimidine-DNA glycosylase